MEITSKTKKLLAGFTAVGALTLGGGTAAFAADTGSATNGSQPAPTANGLRHHGVLRVAVRTAFAAAATTLGTTPHDLRSEMRNGPQSIASIAGDRTDAVKSAIVSALSQKIDVAVANGRFPSGRADGAKARLPQLADRFVNRVPGQHASAPQ